MKKTFVTLALAAKALALGAALFLYTGHTAAQAEDCPSYPCIPNPPDES